MLLKLLGRSIVSEGIIIWALVFIIIETLYVSNLQPIIWQVFKWVCFNIITKQYQFSYTQLQQAFYLKQSTQHKKYIKQKLKMIQFIYVVFFWLIVFQVAIFSFLNIPSPVSWRATFIRFINTNYYVRVILRYHLWLCIISAFFFYDMYGTEKSFLNEVLNIKQKADGNIATELRRGYLSYTILKIQRNEYITLMLIYVSIALHIYLAMLHHIFTKRAKYHEEGKQQTMNKKAMDATPSSFLFGIK